MNDCGSVGGIKIGLISWSGMFIVGDSLIITSSFLGIMAEFWRLELHFLLKKVPVSLNFLIICLAVESLMDSLWQILFTDRFRSKANSTSLFLFCIENELPKAISSSILTLMPFVPSINSN